MSHLARATQEPDIVREIEDSELLDLHRQGILYSYEHTDEASVVLGGVVKTPGKWKAPDKGAELAKPAPDAAAAPASADQKGE